MTDTVKTVEQPAKLTTEQVTAWMQGMRMELDELKKAQIAAVPTVTTNVGDGYVVQMNIRGYDELGREVMWNVRGKTLEEFDAALNSKGERINKLQSIRPIKTETLTVADGEQAPVCAIHNKPMVKRSRKDGSGTFFSCAEKLGDGTWCPYKPVKK